PTPHPLDPASAGEYRAAREALRAAGLLASGTRFAYLGLAEPPKAAVLDLDPAAPPDRRLGALLIDVVPGELSDLVVAVGRSAVVSRRVLDPGTDGQVPILDEDFARVDDIVHGDPRWRAAMARRGLTDVAAIRVCPLTAGSYGLPGEEGRRL